MAVMKVLEIMAESTVSFEKAIENAINKTSDSVSNIRGAHVKEQHVTVKNGKVDKYRVNLKVSFEVK